MAILKLNSCCDWVFFSGVKTYLQLDVPYFIYYLMFDGNYQTNTNRLIFNLNKSKFTNS